LLSENCIILKLKQFCIPFGYTVYARIIKDRISRVFCAPQIYFVEIYGCNEFL